MDDEERQNVLWPSVPLRESNWVIRVFSSSRYFAAFAVLGTFLAAVTLYVYGTLVVIQLIWHTLEEYRFSVAFGLYQLFIQPDLPVPSWLRIHNLDQLTERLIEVVGVLLSVTFLAFAVEGLREASLVEFGASVAVVIAALSLLLVVTHRRPGDHGSSPGE